MDTRGQIVTKEHIGQTTLSPIGAAVLLHAGDERLAASNEVR